MTQRAHSVKSKPDEFAPTTDAALTPNTDMDLFRIKIWDKATDEVIFDNQMGEGDDGYADTEIGGGNIRIGPPRFHL